MVKTYGVQCGVSSVSASNDLNFTSVNKVWVIEIACAGSLIDCLLKFKALMIVSGHLAEPVSFPGLMS